MNFKLLTAAAVLTTAIAAPALAQDPAARSPAAIHQQRAERFYHRDRSFWPGDIAAGVVGGAIGTADAIVSAPFRNDAYAYNSGYYGQRYYGGYNSGFVCEPGTTFRGEDGLRHICQ